MRRSLLVLVMSAFAVSVAGQCPAQVTTAAGSLPTQRMLAPYGLERAWWSQAVLNAYRDKVRHLVADEETLFVQATSGMITAFDAENGKKLWATQLGRTDQSSQPVVTNQDYALVACGMMLYGLNKRTGDLKWEIRLPASPSTSPSTDENHVYIGTLDGSIYAFDLRMIRKLYTENLLPQYSLETQLWRYKTAREVTTPPISDGVRVSFASLDKNLYTVTAKERQLVFQFETDAAIAAPMASLDNWLYLPAQDLKFYCINGLNGGVRWEIITGFPIRSAPKIVDRRVYVTPDHGGMYCINADSGAKVWWRPNVTSFLAVSQRYVFGTDPQGNVTLLAKESGTPAGVLPLRAFNQRLHNDRTDRLFMATESGTVVCLRERGREFPVYHKYPELRPIVPLLAPDEPEEGGAVPAPPQPGAGNEN